MAKPKTKTTPRIVTSGDENLNKEDIEAILHGSSPESFQYAKQQEWFDDALNRVLAISKVQSQQLKGFGCDEDLSRKLVLDLVRRFDSYFTESGYQRLVSSTGYLMEKA